MFDRRLVLALALAIANSGCAALGGLGDALTFRGDVGHGSWAAGGASIDNAFSQVIPAGQQNAGPRSARATGWSPKTLGPYAAGNTVVVPRSWARRFVCIAPNGDMVGVAQPSVRAAIARCAQLAHVDTCRCV